MGKLIRAKQINIDADLPLHSHKITGLADPTTAQDAATKAYVDALISGLSWKQPVRAATTVNGTLSTAFANGQTIDGVTLATGNRILLKNQTTGSQNGIYTVNSSGAPTRATDADSATELLSASVFVEEGGQAGKSYVQTATGITVGTTALVFVQINNSSVAGVPTTADKGSAAAVTASDGDTTGVSITAAPASAGYVQVFVNGVKVRLGDGDKTHDCYFSADGGTTSKAIAAIAAADTLYWNGSIAAYQLDTTDVIDLDYSV